MYMVVHAAVGAVAGQAVNHMSAAFLLGVISHFFLDMIPHGDENLYQGYVQGKRLKRGYFHVGLDVWATVVFCLVISAYVSQGLIKSPEFIIWGIIGGLLPDVLVAVSHFLRPKKTKGLIWRLDRYNAFHRWNHALLMKRWKRIKKDVPYIFGFIFQGVLLIILIKLIM